MMEAEGSLWNKKAPGVYGSGRFSLASSHGTPHGCFTQPNIKDLHLLRGEFQSGGTATSPSDTSPGIPTAMALHNILFSAVCTHQPLKATKKEKELGGGGSAHD